MSNLTDTEYCRLVGASSAAEFSRTCRKIKAAHGGEYPSDWFEKVIKANLRGLLGFDDTITIEPVN